MHRGREWHKGNANYFTFLPRMYKYILAEISYIWKIWKYWPLLCESVELKETETWKSKQPIKSDQHIYIWSLIPLSINKVQKTLEVSTGNLWGTRDQIAKIHWITEKAKKFQKKSASLTMLKPLTLWITTHCEKFL